jgi:AcrR family transcriptional regulator
LVGRLREREFVVARRSGRRRGDSGTRTAIRAAAGHQFAERGYDRTSLRSIAAEAGVDPSLVAHFFGSKHKLFVEVVALPFDPAQAFQAVFAGNRDEIGHRLAAFLVSLFDEPEAQRRITGLVRAAASEPEAARMVRQLITHEILAHIVEALDMGDGEFRASLVSSQVVGVLMARYIVGIEPLASMPAETVAEAIGPNLQRYLTESLPSLPRRKPARRRRSASGKAREQ